MLDSMEMIYLRALTLKLVHLSNAICPVLNSVWVSNSVLCLLVFL